MKLSPDSKRRIRLEASHWLVELSSEDVCKEDQVNFVSWLAENPHHEPIYRELEQVYAGLSQLQHLGDEWPLPSESSASSESDFGITPTPEPQLPEKRFTKAASAISAIAATLVFGLGIAMWFSIDAVRNQSSPVVVDNATQNFSTTVAEIRPVHLPDGSVVTLSAQSEIEATINSDDRFVLLKSGQAFFEIAHDSSRPFTVRAGETSLRVLGTKFDVRLGPEAVDISVLEGKVQVIKSDLQSAITFEGKESANARLLVAGQTMAATLEGQLAPIEATHASSPGSWREGLLVYENAKLLDIISDVSRYYSGTIEVSDPDILELRVTAAFRSDQVEQMLQILTRALPVEVVRDDTGRIVLVTSAS